MRRAATDRICDHYRQAKEANVALYTERAAQGRGIFDGEPISQEELDREREEREANRLLALERRRAEKEARLAEERERKRRMPVVSASMVAFTASLMGAMRGRLTAG